MITDLCFVQAPGVGAAGVTAAATAWPASLSEEQRTAASLEFDPESFKPV